MSLFTKRTLVQKICILSLLFLTIPTLFFSFYLYKKQTRELHTQLIHEQGIAIEQTTKTLDNILTSISDLSRDIAYSQPLNNYLGKHYRMGLNKFPVWSEKYLGEIIASIKYSLKYRNLGVNTANIFTTTPLEEEGSYFWSADRLVNLDFFQQFQEAESEFGLFYLDTKQTEVFHDTCGYSTSSADKNIILVIQKINTEYQGSCMGYIVFECSPSKIFPTLFRPSQNGNYFAWFQDSPKGYGAEPPQNLEELLNDDANSAPFFINSGKEQYICCMMEHFDIMIMNTQPLTFYSSNRPVFSLSLVLASFAVLQFILLTIFIRKSFHQLHTDLNLMDAIIAHGFKEKIPETRSDEIGMIAHRYNILLDKINSLIQETVEKETTQTQAQLKALQYQINPHFIYNTLSIFSGYASQHGQEILAESIASFGQILRYNIKNDGLYATIESELRTAVSLINVYNIRYFNQLRLTTDVPESVQKIQIIKFLLQPLLENSILHGLVSPNTSLHIHISIKPMADFMEIKVCDDGDGMSPDRLSEVLYSLEHPSETLLDSSNGTFIGLQNIYRRLKLFYSQRAQLTIESREHHGTTIMIYIPADVIKEE